MLLATHIYSSALLALLPAFALVPLASAAQEAQREAGTGGLHSVTLVRTLDAVRDGRDRLRHQKKSEQHRDLLADGEGDGPGPLGHLRRVQEDSGTCEETLAACQAFVLGDEEEEEQPTALFVQMADQCTFQTTDSGNVVLKSRHFHGDTVVFSDRPSTYEKEMSTETFFNNFDDAFNDDNGGKPNAAVTLVQNDESQDIVVSVFVKAVVKHRDDPDGKPTYVYKLEQSDDQASVKSLRDVMGGKDKVTYDHCSIFVDSYGYGAQSQPQPGKCGGMCWHDYQCKTSSCPVCNNGQACVARSQQYSCGSSCQNNNQCASGATGYGGCRYCVNSRCDAQPASSAAYSCGSSCQNNNQCASGTTGYGGCRYCVNSRCDAQPAQTYQCNSSCQTNAQCKSGIPPGVRGGCSWCYRGKCSA